MAWLLAMVFYIFIFLVLFLISLPQGESILLPLLPSFLSRVSLVQWLFYLFLSAVLYALLYYASRLYKTHLEGQEVTPVWADNLSLLASPQNSRIKAAVSIILLLALLGCLPFIVIGRLEPAYWVLSAVVWVSITFAREGERPKKEEEEPPKPPKRLTPEEMIEYLNSRPDYRGQIVYIEDIPKRKRVPSKQNSLLKVSPPLADALHNLSISQLYEHQEEVARYFEEKKNVLILTPVGSGRSTISDLLAISTVGVNCKNVLYIYPFHKLGDKRYSKFQKLVEETHWNYSFTSSRLVNPEEEFDPQEAMPEILFTTPEALHRRILPEHRLPGWQMFLKDLELVILDDADAYTGVYGAHVAMLLRRLRRVCEHYGTHPVFIASCLPFEGARGFVEDLVGMEFAEVSYNTAGASPKKLVLWNPPLVRVGDSPKLLRRNYFDEAIGLAAETQIHLFHTLLLSKSVRLTGDDISNLKAEIVQRFSDLAESEDVNLKVPMISEEEQFVASSLSMADLPLSGFDSVVMTGFPGSVELVRQEIESVGTEDAEVLTFIVLPQTPLSQYYVKHAPEIFGASERILPLIAVYLSHPHIIKSHLLCSVSELPLRMEDCERFFGDRARGIFEGMIGEGGSRLKKRETEVNGKMEAEYYSDNDKAYHTKVNLNIVSSDFYLIKREGQEQALSAVEVDRAGEKAFSGAVEFYADYRYRVSEIDKEENTVWVVSEPERIRTEKLNQVEVVLEEGYTTETAKIGGGLEFTVGLGQAQISEKILGYAEYTAENVDPDTAESVDLKPKVIRFPEPYQRSFQTWAFFLKLLESNSPEVLHTLAHCIRVSLPAFIHYEGNDLEVAFFKDYPQLEGDVIFVYDNSLYGLFLVRMVKDSIEDILKLSFDILISCPCESGCASCLYIFDCREANMHNQSFDKEGTIKLLGEILQQDYEERIQERTQGVGNIRTLENMLKEAQRTLNESIDLEVVDAIVYLIEKEELQRLTGTTNAIGACVGRDIYVALGLIESKAKDVVAHEYVHVWENLYMADELRDATVVPFDGKLASEGFAQWASAKVLQKDGLWEEMEQKERDLWGWDEYGEGYHIMNYIEENLGGTKAVVEFMKAGMLMKDEEEYNIERLIQESGVEDDIKRREQVSRRKAS